MGRVSLKVVPGASKSELAGKHGDAIKIRLAAPPLDGKANAALVVFLADKLGVAKSAVRVVTGDTSRLKLVEVDGIESAELARRLG